MLGVGYIIGPRVARVMMGGGLLAFWMLVPRSSSSAPWR